jgi:Tfp pilus assembly protein PilN
MIQINLLREPSTRKRLWIPQKSRLELYVGLVAAVAILGVLGWHWRLSSTKEELMIRRAELQQQSLQLAAVRQELNRYEQQKKGLEERSRIIEELRSQQQGPVQLLNAVIAAMPSEPRLWLVTLSQQEEQVTIEGHAFDVPAIADFIGALSAQAPFRNVELAFWEDRKESVAFGLNCTITGSQ